MSRLADKKSILLLLRTDGAQPHIVETDSGYVVEVLYGNEKVRLATTRGHTRHFRTLDTAFDFFKSLGCLQVSIFASAA